MADDLGLSVASYSNIERGITDINVSRLLEISQILRMDVADFLKEKEENSFFQDEGTPYQSPEISSILSMLEKQQNEIEGLKKIIEELISSKR